MYLLASSVALSLGMILCSCSSQWSSRHTSSYQSEMPMEEIHLELADIKHDLKSTQVELNLLDERVKKQVSSSSSLKPSLETVTVSNQMTALEKRMGELETVLQKAANDLRNLSHHTHQALTKLENLEHAITSHEKRLDEVTKLKGTLTSISQAIGQSSPLSTVKSHPTYRVKPGDSLEKIARHHKTNITTLKHLNHLKNDKIVVGQELKIPDDTP